jgi:hypothetical protein
MADRRCRPARRGRSTCGRERRTHWFEKAASGALLDLLVGVGLLLGAMSLFGLEVLSDVVLLGMWAFAIVDGGLRFALIRRRES